MPAVHPVGYDSTKTAFSRAVAFHFIWTKRVTRDAWSSYWRHREPVGITRATATPRLSRATRTARTTTSRRTTTMASSARSSDADDGGGEPPGDPALDAEGRATGGASDDSGPWLTSIKKELLEREVAQHARSRSRYMREVRGTRRWWS
jgi:hypothetical protein